ncbi:MAG: trigger factor, partial [Negativicutes bacterium]|nr:trigger factor [Negativicutes bacterium]
MACTISKLDEHRVELEIEVNEQEFDRAVTAAAARVSQKVKIPGFRPGKAPRRIVENFVGGGYLAQEAFEGVAYRELLKALKDNGLRMYGRPDVEAVQVEIGKPLKFKAVVTLFPEVVLGDYRELEVSFAVEPVSEDMVDARIEEIRRSRSKLVSVTEPLADGDYALIDFVGYVDGKEFDGGRAESYMLEIGSGRFIPGFEQQLLGARQGDQIRVEVR